MRIARVMEYEFSVQAMVRRYHIYQNICDAACDGELLNCERQIEHPHNFSPVAVKKGTTVVCHISRIISTIYSIFIRRGGVIVCRANESLEGKKLSICHTVFAKYVEYLEGKI